MEPLAVLVRRADGGFTVSAVPDEVSRKYGLAEDDRTPWSGWPIVRDRVSEDSPATLCGRPIVFVESSKLPPDKVALLGRTRHVTPTGSGAGIKMTWADELPGPSEDDKEGRGG